MNSTERQSVFSLSVILALRMLGLFMALPLFALYASHLSDATPLLIGLAMGVYGLTQAVLQIPFGMLSDRWGRKKIIALGLLVFMVGSCVTALSHTIWGVLLGRALQGAGAIGSTIMALIADLTREEERTKAMALTGMTIGMSFSLAMMLGPLFAAWIQVSGIFWLAALLSLLAIFLLFTWVPSPKPLSASPAPSSNPYSAFVLWKNPVLMQWNIGIFILHVVFTASFIVIPIRLQTLSHIQGNKQWLIYLPILAIAFCLAIICIFIAEKTRRIKAFFIGGVALLGVAEFLFWIFPYHLLLSAFSLLLFLSAFSLLEAFLPSLVSKTAPSARKGAALGIYSFSQFFGIFVGGAIGGWLYGAFGLIEVNLFCALLTIIWFAIAFHMKNPHYSTTTSSSS